MINYVLRTLCGGVVDHSPPDCGWRISDRQGGKKLPFIPAIPVLGYRSRCGTDYFMLALLSLLSVLTNIWFKQGVISSLLIDLMTLKLHISFRRRVLLYLQIIDFLTNGIFLFWYVLFASKRGWVS